MVEMPRHESPTFEDAIRALELSYSYCAITGLVGKARARNLESRTSRGAVGFICNPIFGTPADELRRQLPETLKSLRVGKSASESEQAGVANLRATLEAYLNQG